MLTDLIPPSKDTVWQTGLKKKIQNFCLQENHLIYRNKHWIRVKGWKKIYQANGPQKKAGVTYLSQTK
jgi:hypothetical protein